MEILEIAEGVTAINIGAFDASCENMKKCKKLADLGLDENGCKRFDLGSTIVEATVGQDFSICLYDTKGSEGGKASA